MTCTTEQRSGELNSRLSDLAVSAGAGFDFASQHGVFLDVTTRDHPVTVTGFSAMMGGGQGLRTRV
jgi:hypothetical protein